MALKDSLDISRRSTCVDGPILEQGAGDVILTSVAMQKNGDVLNDGEDVAMKDVTDENKNEPKDGEVSVRGRNVLYGGDLYYYISGCATFQQQLSHVDSRVCVCVCVSSSFFFFFCLWSLNPPGTVLILFLCLKLPQWIRLWKVTS